MKKFYVKTLMIPAVIAVLIGCGDSVSEIDLSTLSSDDDGTGISQIVDGTESADSESAATISSQDVNLSSDGDSNAAGSSDDITTVSSVVDVAVSSGASGTSEPISSVAETPSSVAEIASSTTSVIGTLYLYENTLMASTTWWSTNTDLDDTSGEIIADFHAGWGEIVMQFPQNPKGSDFSEYSTLRFDCATTTAEKVVVKIFWGETPAGHTVEGWPYWTNAADGGVVEADVTAAQCSGAVSLTISTMKLVAGVLDLSQVRELRFLGDEAIVTLDNVRLTGDVEGDESSATESISSVGAESSTTVIVSSVGAVSSSSALVVSSAEVVSSSSSALNTFDGGAVFVDAPTMNVGQWGGATSEYGANEIDLTFNSPGGIYFGYGAAAGDEFADATLIATKTLSFSVATTLDLEIKIEWDGGSAAQKLSELGAARNGSVETVTWDMSTVTGAPVWDYMKILFGVHASGAGTAILDNVTYQ